MTRTGESGIARFYQYALRAPWPHRIPPRPASRRCRSRPATTRASTSRPATPTSRSACGSATRSTSGPGRCPNGSLWVTLFDRAAQGPRAHKETLPGPAATGGDWIGVGEAALRPGHAQGRDRRRRVGPHLQRARAAAVPPAPRLDVPGSAAAHEAAQPGAGGPLQRDAARRRPHRGRRRLARGDRPQLGRAARRALDLAARTDRGGRLAGRRARQGQARPPDDAVGRERRAVARRRAPRARRPGPQALGARGAGRAATSC